MIFTQEGAKSNTTLLALSQWKNTVDGDLRRENMIDEPKGLIDDEPKGLISRADEEAMEYEFQKQKEQEIVKMWMEDNDLTISWDLDINENKVYFISDIADPSVGIFQYDYSPSFRTETEAYRWCKAIMELCDVWKKYEQLYEKEARK